MARWNGDGLMDAQGKVFAAWPGQRPTQRCPCSRDAKATKQDVLAQYNTLANLVAPARSHGHRELERGRARRRHGAAERRYRGAARPRRCGSAARAFHCHGVAGSGARSSPPWLTWTCVTPTASPWAGRQPTRRVPETRGTDPMSRKTGQASDRGPRRGHLQGGGHRRRDPAGRRRGDRRHRLASLARPEEGRGGEHRVHRAVHPAGGGGSRAHGRLPDPFGVHRHRRQPRAQPELPWRGGDPRQGMHRRRRGARHRRGARGQHPGGPEDPARAAPGFHHRRPGRHPRTHRHVRRATRSARAHRHRRRQRRPEHRALRGALRPQGGRRDPGADWRPAMRC